jgi:hypothetical protein
VYNRTIEDDIGRLEQLVITSWTASIGSNDEKLIWPRVALQNVEVAAQSVASSARDFDGVKWSGQVTKIASDLPRIALRNQNCFR